MSSLLSSRKWPVLDIDFVPNELVEIKSSAHEIRGFFLGKIPTDSTLPGSANLAQCLINKVAHNYFAEAGLSQHIPVLVFIINHRAAFLLAVVEFGGFDIAGLPGGHYSWNRAETEIHIDYRTADGELELVW